VPVVYTPPFSRIDDEAAFDLLDVAPLGHLVSVSADGLEATTLPVLADRVGRRLRGHVARANAHWKCLHGADVLVMFVASSGYVSPAWYPSKTDDARVVPTWNYEVVHVRGVARVHDDAEWLRLLVDDLTRRHESERTDGAAVWAVTDAPPDFIDRQLEAIVGVEVEITSIEGKRKLSQNRSAADHDGVADALGRSARRSDRELGDAMRDRRRGGV
jgi:transcriptional regulator